MALQGTHCIVVKKISSLSIKFEAWTQQSIKHSKKSSDYVSENPVCWPGGVLWPRILHGRAIQLMMMYRSNSRVFIMHTTNISICIGQTHLALLDAKLNYRNQADLLDTEDLNLKQILIFNAWACSQAQVEMSWPIIWIPTYTNNKYMVQYGRWLLS